MAKIGPSTVHMNGKLRGLAHAAIIFILIIAVLVVIAAIATGFLEHQPDPRPPRRPRFSATHNGVVAKGGQAPAFDVETGSVKVGTKETTVKVPAWRFRSPRRTRRPRPPTTRHS